MPLGNNSELAVRAELITQSIDDGAVPVGEESPDLDAYLIQLNYSLLW